MSDLKMGEVIAGIREEAKKLERNWFQKLLDRARRPFTWLAWNLWGRRRAIKRMQLLAGVNVREDHDDSYLGKPEKAGVIDYPYGKLEATHLETVRRIEELREPLPRPDVVDDPEAN